MCNVLQPNMNNLPSVAVRTKPLMSNLRRRKLHSSFAATGCLLAVVLLQGCDRTPEFVFVLEAPQTVELAASASARSIAVGEPVVLYAERRTKGSWTRIPSKELKPDQCWMAALPPEQEAAVADNLHWIAEPAGAAMFNTGFRPDRTRTVVLSKPGAVKLTPSTSVWCEPGRSVPASPLLVEAMAK